MIKSFLFPNNNNNNKEFSKQGCFIFNKYNVEEGETIPVSTKRF